MFNIHDTTYDYTVLFVGSVRGLYGTGLRMRNDDECESAISNTTVPAAVHVFQGLSCRLSFPPITLCCCPHLHHRPRSTTQQLHLVHDEQSNRLHSLALLPAAAEAIPLLRRRQHQVAVRQQPQVGCCITCKLVEGSRKERTLYLCVCCVSQSLSCEHCTLETRRYGV